MTRSVARRQNRNARYVAATIHIDTLYTARSRTGPFTEVSARQLAYANGHKLDTERLAEVNWPLAAERMNERSRPIY